MTDSLASPARSRFARIGLISIAAAAALAALLLRPVAASPAAQGTPPKPAAAADEDHGGDLVFHVVSKTQKYSVLYSHQSHIDAGIECAECHESVFQKKLNSNQFKMADINRGKFCGVCHTETPAADVKHPAFAPKKNCQKCHTLRIREP